MPIAALTAVSATVKPQRLRDLLRGKLSFVSKASHIWWGVSVEDRKHGLPRVAHLAAAPAANRFLSIAKRPPWRI